ATFPPVRGDDTVRALVAVAVPAGRPTAAVERTLRARPERSGVAWRLNQQRPHTRADPDGDLLAGRHTLRDVEQGRRPARRRRRNHDDAERTSARTHELRTRRRNDRGLE